MTFPRRLAGKILLDVEKNGEAYYVYPKDMSVHLSWYAVKLTDNNIYYGSSKDIKSNPLVLENSYYDAWGPFETPGIPDLNGRSIGIIGTTNIPQEKIKLIEPLAKESNLVKALMETGGGNKNIWLKH